MRDDRASGVRVSRAAAALTFTPSTLGHQLLAAIELLDEEAATAVLDVSERALGLSATIDEVLLPSMREVGERWSRGVCDVAQEQLATTTIQAWLVRRSAEAPPASHDGLIVLACGPQDQHTISLTAFTALLRHEGFRCLDLGAQISTDALLCAVEGWSAQAVVLVSQLARNRAAARSALQGVSDTGATLFYAGASFRTVASRHQLPGHYLGGNLTHAATHVATQLRNH